MRIIKSIFIISIFFISAGFIMKPVSWKVKDGYNIQVMHDGFVIGNFTGLKANIVFDEEKPESSSFSAIIDATTIKNHEAKEHLAVAKFKTITFVSSAIKKTKDGYEATGKLTVKGITKETKLPFKFDSKKDNATQFPFMFKETFYGKFTINPKDFNINEKATLIIDFTLPVTK